MAILVSFGALVGVEAPKVANNLPTPWIGIWERINIGVFMVWVIVLAVALLRARRSSEALLVDRPTCTVHVKVGLH